MADETKMPKGKPKADSSAAKKEDASSLSEKLEASPTLGSGEYELIPHKEIIALRDELKRLKDVPTTAGKQVHVSLHELNQKIDTLNEILKNASKQMEVEEGGTSFKERMKPYLDKMNKILEQNAEIAEGIVALADMLKELKTGHGEGAVEAMEPQFEDHTPAGQGGQSNVNAGSGMGSVGPSHLPPPSGLKPPGHGAPGAGPDPFGSLPPDDLGGGISANTGAGGMPPPGMEGSPGPMGAPDFGNPGDVGAGGMGAPFGGPEGQAAPGAPGGETGLPPLGGPYDANQLPPPPGGNPQGGQGQPPGLPPGMPPPGPPPQPAPPQKKGLFS